MAAFSISCGAWPNIFLKSLEKYAGLLKPTVAETSEMV